MMTFTRRSAGRHAVVFGVLAISLLAGPGRAAEPFPFNQELVLDAAPMRPAKRVPILTVAPNGDATIDLWCRTVAARVDLSDATVKIEPGPLPEALPEMMADGQCTPARMQEDQDLLAQLAQVTAWRVQAGAVVLAGPKTLKFRPSDH